MTPLTQILIERIGQTGPITVADYMAECLLHPEHGYYTTRTPFGRDGDFTTAPEISQMFGEMIGLALAQAWMDQGAPTPFMLAELGPGRGTLMADILRATARVPNFHAGASVHLIEASKALREEQAKAITTHDPIWHDDVDALPDDLPMFVVANEFFDALPIRQFIRDGRGWRERRVGVQEDVLSFGAGDATPVAALAQRLLDTGDGDMVELRPAQPAIITALTTRIAENNGGAIIIDYGDWQSKGDTLQALRAHEFCAPLEHAGHADLTAHVDFADIAAHAGAATVSHMTPQGVLLERLGITARAQSLANSMTGDALNQHIAEHRRLTHPDEMGTLFKAIAITPPNAPMIAGFDT